MWEIKDYIGTMSEKEKNIWMVICDLKGLVLRAQLVILLDLLYKIEASSVSAAIAKFKGWKLIETRCVFPNCNSVMVVLSRKGKALVEGKAANSIPPMTNSMNNDLRAIFRTERMIAEIKAQKNMEPLDYWKNRLLTGLVLLSKNEYLQLYNRLEKGCKGYFKMPDLVAERINLHNKIGSVQDYYNLYNAMSREFYLRYVSCKEKTVKITILYYGVNQFREKKIWESVYFIYLMLKRYFRLKTYGDVDLDISFIIYTFDRYDEESLRKKVTNKMLMQYLIRRNAYNHRDKITLRIWNNGFDEKYNLRRPL